MIEFIYLITVAGGMYFLLTAFNKTFLPKIICKSMKEIDRNPKWITSKLNYYGFDDIDIILCESKWVSLPYFSINKNSHLELWITTDTSTKEVEDIGHLALCAKLKIKYGMWFPEKPIYWLSILLYMLDGGNVEIINKKPLD